MTDLDAIRQRLNAATPGPWHGEHELYEGRELPCMEIGNYGWVCAGERAPAYDVDSEQGMADAEFIAHARQDIPDLLAEIDRLQAELKAAQVIPLGDHLKEPGGWCRTHSIHHSEVEWARIHDQLQREEEGERRGR